MSVEHMAVVLHHSRAKGTAKLVLIGIANHAGDGGAWPSIATLAHYANVVPRNVNKAIATLQSLGEIRVYVQAGGTHTTDDHRRPNRYDVLVSCPPWCDRTPNHRDTRARTRQPGLWKTPLSETTPPVGIDTPPLSESTGEPLSHATPEPSKEPTLNRRGGPASPTDRARDAEVCAECSQPRWACKARERTSGHTFTPTCRYSPGGVDHAHCTTTCVTTDEAQL